MVWYKRSLPTQEAIGRANKYLEQARCAKDERKALALCGDAKDALGRIDVSTIIKDREQIMSAYREHGKFLQTLGFEAKAKTSFSKADELR